MPKKYKNKIQVFIDGIIDSDLSLRTADTRSGVFMAAIAVRHTGLKDLLYLAKFAQYLSHSRCTNFEADLRRYYLNMSHSYRLESQEAVANLREILLNKDKDLEIGDLDSRLILIKKIIIDTLENLKND